MEVNQFNRYVIGRANTAVRNSGVVTSAICFERGAAHLRQASRGLHHEGRLVAFAAMRDGREIGAVGLDQQAIVGRDARGLADGFGLGKREHAAEAEVEAEVERLARLRLRRR